MSHPSLRAKCLLFMTGFLIALPAESRAVLLRGDVTGTITSTGFGSVPEGQPVPFGLDPAAFANNGLPITVRFWLDTDLMPAGSSLLYSEETNPATNWLRAEIEVNGVVEPIETNYLLFSEPSVAGEADALHFQATFYDPTDIVRESLDVTVESASFGLGPPPWTDLEVTPNYNSPISFRMLQLGAVEGDYSSFSLDGQSTSLSFHPVPEPAALGLLSLAGSLSILRRRSV